MFYQYKNIKFQVWDLGGQSSIRWACCVLFPWLGFTTPYRSYWRCYFPNTSAIIYVIDSSDTARLNMSRAELLTMLSEEELKGVPLLVFCNKQDIQSALKPEDISEQLGLAGGEKSRPWSVRGCCATKGEGLEEGLDWYAHYSLSRGVWLTWPSRLVNAIQSKWFFLSHSHFLAISVLHFHQSRFISTF